MMLFTDTNTDELSADAEDPDAGADLDESLLDEITNDESSETDEGFGHLPETDDDEKDEKESEEEDEEDLLEEEEDAEDVDYDTFDDIDEM